MKVELDKGKPAATKGATVGGGFVISDLFYPLGMVPLTRYEDDQTSLIILNTVTGGHDVWFGHWSEVIGAIKDTILRLGPQPTPDNIR